VTLRERNRVLNKHAKSPLHSISLRAVNAETTSEAPPLTSTCMNMPKTYPCRRPAVMTAKISMTP